MTRLLTAIALIATALVGCGGGGGVAGTATSAFSGVAVDGYLHNARAFLDLNNNGTYDAGEPSAMTNSSGGFTLEATQEQIDTYPVVVVAIAGTTIDQDSPGAPMTSGMTLMSPPGNHSVVSPLTTQVVAKMATGLSLADAKTAVQTDLGLTGVDLMKDFVFEKTTNPAYAEAHRIAVSVADVLKTVESESTSSTSLTDRLANARTKVTSNVVPLVAQIKQASSNEDAAALVAMNACGTHYNSVNKHHYKYVAAANLSWNDAKELAAVSTCRGNSGYLVTVTTQQELTFIDTVLFPNQKPDFTYIGAADLNRSGSWRWVTGPEGLLNDGAGAIFYTASSGAAVNGYFASWYNLPQANSRTYRYAGMYSWFTAKFQPWNEYVGDPSPGGGTGYIIEYGN